MIFLKNLVKNCSSSKVVYIAIYVLNERDLDFLFAATEEISTLTCDEKPDRLDVAKNYNEVTQYNIQNNGAKHKLCLIY